MTYNVTSPILKNKLGWAVILFFSLVAIWAIIKLNYQPNREFSSIHSSVEIELPTIPQDPTVSPGPDWEWRGGEKGQWYNPKTQESLRPDLDHPEPIGPHWDYTKRGQKGGWRIYPDGRTEPK